MYLQFLAYLFPAVSVLEFHCSCICAGTKYNICFSNLGFVCLDQQAFVFFDLSYSDSGTFSLEKFIIGDNVFIGRISPNQMV